MLNTGKNFRTLRDKKINILILVLYEKKILNETKNHNPPFKLNGWSLRWSMSLRLFHQSDTIMNCDIVECLP